MRAVVSLDWEVYELWLEGGERELSLPAPAELCSVIVFNPGEGVDLLS
jgi:hypothetical protein